MITHLLNVLFQVVLTALLLKIYHDTVVKKLSINDGPTTIQRLEQRNAQLMEREAAAQDKLWKLEDENLLLKIRVRELLYLQRLNEPEAEDEDDEMRRL